MYVRPPLKATAVSHHVIPRLPPRVYVCPHPRSTHVYPAIARPAARTASLSHLVASLARLVFWVCPSLISRPTCSSRHPPTRPSPPLLVYTSRLTSRLPTLSRYAPARSSYIHPRVASSAVPCPHTLTLAPACNLHKPSPSPHPREPLSHALVGNIALSHSATRGMPTPCWPTHTLLVYRFACHHHHAHPPCIHTYVRTYPNTPPNRKQHAVCLVFFVSIANKTIAPSVAVVEQKPLGSALSPLNGPNSGKTYMDLALR